MGALTAGSIVLVTFPFSDLSISKLRPAVVLASVHRGDWIPVFFRLVVRFHRFYAVSFLATATSTISSLSGFSNTSDWYSQFLVSPDHLSGWLALACL